MHPEGQTGTASRRAYSDLKCPGGSKSSQIAGHYWLRDARRGASWREPQGASANEMPGVKLDGTIPREHQVFWCPEGCAMLASPGHERFFIP